MASVWRMKMYFWVFMKTVMMLFLYILLLSVSRCPSLTNEGSFKQEDNVDIHTGGSDVGVPRQITDLRDAATSLGPPLDSLERKMYPDLQGCSGRPLRSFYYHRGDYWIMENYIPADLSFRCDESVTFTTHGDYTFLTNLDQVTARWQGPVSVVLYAPGEDFSATIAAVLYLRQCGRQEIRKLVTFHLFFHDSHTPMEIPSSKAVLGRVINCQSEAPEMTNVTTYRSHRKLLYPINVARNIARLAAQTYFVLPADFELYPSINFIPEFLRMLKKPDVSNTSDPRVFVFSIFEVKENIRIPETKSELLTLLNETNAIPFHENICPACHAIPGAKEWMEAIVQPGMSVFHIGKRTPPFQSWEPFYVGTNHDPLFDERLSWEGMNDKMVQAYIMCLRNYEFHVLDNSFLVHRPGIKMRNRTPFRNAVINTQNILIHTKIKQQYRTIFSTGKNCSI